MKVLKTIAIIIGSLVAIFLLLGLILPKDIQVERSVDVGASVEAVWPHIKYFEKQQSWSPWLSEDPEAKTWTEGTDGTMGAKNFWEGDKTGKGSQEVTELKENEMLATHLDFGDQGEADAWLRLAKGTDAGNSKVTWGFKSHMGFPSNVFGNLMVKGMIGKSYEKGLSNLKAIAENSPAPVSKTFRGMEVKSVSLPARKFLAYREEIPMDQFQAFFGEHFGFLSTYIMDAGLEMDGMPCALYYKWDEENRITDMAAAMPVKSGTDYGKYKMIEIPASNALSIDYYGGYSGIGEAHYAMDDYMKEMEMEWAEPAIEEYVTDPGTEPDSSKWLTRLTYYFK